MEIRTVLKEDNGDLAQLIRDIFDEHAAPRNGTIYTDPTTDNLFELFGTSASELWIALNQGKIIGCCGIYPTEGLPPDHAELVKFYVSREFRGRGLGESLFRKSVLSAREFGYRYLYLESLPEFAGAVSFYHRIGFQALSEPMGRSGHDTCSIWMLAELKDL